MASTSAQPRCWRQVSDSESLPSVAHWAKVVLEPLPWKASHETWRRRQDLQPHDHRLGAHRITRHLRLRRLFDPRLQILIPLGVDTPVYPTQGLPDARVLKKGLPTKASQSPNLQNTPLRLSFLFRLLSSTSPPNPFQQTNDSFSRGLLAFSWGARVFSKLFFCLLEQRIGKT